MARKKRELTRVSAAGRPKWRTMRHGKLYHFRGTYEEALAQWQTKLRELEQDDAKPAYITGCLEKMQRWFRANGMPDEANEIDPSGDKLQWQGIPQESRAVWLERFRAMEQPQGNTPTVGQAVDMFLARQQARMTAGKMTAGYFSMLQRCVEHFAEHLGKRAIVTGINGHNLEAYHTALLQKIGTDWTPEYADCFMSSAKTFIRWAWRGELIDSLPRNIDSQDITIECPPKKLKVFTIDEITTLLGNCSDRTRCYLLLMLNCGMTQKDISDLRPDEVNWTTGRITRKRSKTNKSESTPEVSYPLWASTFTLVKKFGLHTGDRVFLNENGKPLKTERIDNGKLNKIDNIATSYARLLRKLKNREENPVKISKSLKIFRKTSPSIMQRNPAYAHCARHFLGHSPRGVTDKNYVTPDQGVFDSAVKWIGQELGQ